ncbi:hypothetical protein [Ornithinimicrobium murale]|uniref:hypothetical protein n=1 Tax=Ornithinimicrobium murale TaxID=1050153 RepID=UPI000E0CC57B|nr:hypothetical protein [Ornithinimicrobium murale]
MSSVVDEVRRRTPGELSRSRQEAGRMRAQWLMALSEGNASLHELFTAATRDGGQPLRALRLRMAIEHVPGITRARAGAVIAELRHLAGVAQDVPDRELNVAWLLLDQRTQPGARLTGLSTALLRQTGGLEQTTVGGFPYRHLGGMEEVVI